MALPATFDKTRKDLEKALTDSTPLLAVVGAGDLAVEMLRKVGAGLNARATDLNARVSHVDATAVRGQAKARVEGLQSALQSRMDAVQADVLAAPDQVKELPSKAQAKAQAALDTTYSTALSRYDDLAGRGKTLVTRIRKQQASADLEQQVGSTVSRAKGTATTAKKSASRTKSAAKSTTTTAKKQA
ncbi:MAG: hypothetical protein ACRDO2_05625, partial [Nocardioidaceae bacterium]